MSNIISSKSLKFNPVKLLSSLVLGVSLLMAIGCQKKTTKSEYGLDINDTLRINILTEPPTLDWNKSSDTTSSMIQGNIMEGLVEYDFSDNEVNIVPALATQWKALNESKTWVFTIRQGVKWSDGQIFEPKHVVDGWKRLLEPATASPYSYFLYSIKNARAYNEGKIKDFSKVGVSIKGNEITVELEQSGYFPYLLTHQSTYPIRTDIIAKFGDKWTEAGNLVGLGPYNLKNWDHDKAIVLERNPLYFKDPAKTKYILAYMITEQTTAINLFDTGKLDAQMSLPSSELPMLKKRKEYNSQSSLITYYYGMNTKIAPTNDPLVRKALAMAIDKKQITDFMQGGETPLKGWLPKGMFGYDEEIGLNFDPAKAKELLKQAGYGPSKPFPKITLSYNTNENHKRVAENVQAQLRKNLNVNVEIKNEEWKVYLGTLKAQPAHMYRMGWVADYPDPSNFFNLMTSYSENNYTGWGSSNFDTFVKKASSTIDKTKRKELFNQAHKILVEDDVPVIPVYASVSHSLISSRIKNFPKNVMSQYRFHKVEIQP